MSIKSGDCRAQVAKQIGVDLERESDLDEQIVRVLDCEHQDQLFLRAMARLSGLTSNPDVLGSDKVAISRLQKLLTRRIFPRGLLRQIIARMKDRAGVVADAAATDVGPEILTRVAAGYSPDFDYAGKLHLVRVPLGDPSPESLVAEILKDLAGQANIDLGIGQQRGAGANDSVRSIERLRRLATRVHQSVLGSKQDIADLTDPETPLCYCVFDRPRVDEYRGKLHEVIRFVHAKVPELLFFELGPDAPAADDERTALEFVGGEPAGRSVL